MTSGNDIIIKLNELTPILYREYSAKQIGLSGFFSDGSNTEIGDIDLLVEFEKPLDWSTFH